MLEIVTISYLESGSLRRHDFRVILGGFEEALCFCDCSATNESILDFSIDSESLGHPLDADIGGRCPKISESQSAEPGCPGMSENVRISIFGHFRTFSDISGHFRTF